MSANTDAPGLWLIIYFLNTLVTVHFPFNCEISSQQKGLILNTSMDSQTSQGDEHSQPLKTKCPINLNDNNSLPYPLVH